MSFHSHKAPSFIHRVTLVSDLISIYIQRSLLLMLNFFEYKLRKSENLQRLKEMIRIFFFHSLALAKFVIAEVGASEQCEKRFIENTFD